MNLLHKFKGIYIGIPFGIVSLLGVFFGSFSIGSIYPNGIPGFFWVFAFTIGLPGTLSVLSTLGLGNLVKTMYGLTPNNSELIGWLAFILPLVLASFYGMLIVGIMNIISGIINRLRGRR